MIQFDDFRHWSMLPKTAICICGDPLSNHSSYRKEDFRHIRVDDTIPSISDMYIRVETERNGRRWIVQIPRDDGRTWCCSGNCRWYEFRCKQFIEATIDQQRFADERLVRAKRNGPKRFRNAVRRMLDDILDHQASRFPVGREQWDEWCIRRDEMGDYE